MFELAAFRKANPSSPIVVVPLFLARSVAICYAWFGLVALSFLLFFNVTNAEFRQPNLLWLFGIVVFVPLYLLSHFLRKSLARHF